MSGILAAMPGIVTSGGAPPSGPPFSYDFTGANNDPWDAAKWTTLAGTTAPNIQSNAGNFVPASFGQSGVAYTGGSCATVNQYHRFTLTAFAANSFLQIIFRYTNSLSAFYIMEFDPTSTTIVWQYCANLAALIAGTTTTIQTGAPIAGWTAGDTVSITLSGTGAATEMNVWRNATGNAPTSASVWGGSGPGANYTNNPAIAVDTGTVLCLACVQNTGNSTQIDTWFGGDI